MKAIPKLEVTREPQRRALEYDQEKDYAFRYRASYHQELPHVVKFSGGRTSGMLLFTLLENGLLNRRRGDVVVFNNTSAEHPETYKFVSECKKRVESYGIPFFLIQFCTYEDLQRGWSRFPSYKLVNDRPISEDNPDGFEWRGEAFEELLSHNLYVPNQFVRKCTLDLKLQTTRRFLQDWFANKESILRLGHGLTESMVDPEGLYKRHVRNKGKVPKDVFLEKKSYLLTRPTTRPKQYYQEFSEPAMPFNNRWLKVKTRNQKVRFGERGVEYVSFVGFRGDEQLRVRKAKERSVLNKNYAGEESYMTLADMNVQREDVNAFWSQQDWDLKLPTDGSLSNCTFCFLKGVNNLKIVRKAMEDQKFLEIEGFEAHHDSPCSTDWWSLMEQKYKRVAPKRGREKNEDGTEFVGFGFFGKNSKFSYDLLARSEAEGDDLSRFTDTVLPCDCTD